MEIDYMGYRIEYLEETDEAYVYRNNYRIMHLLLSCKQTPEKLARDIKETMRILDI